MKKSNKIILGFCTIVPFLYFIFFFIYIFANIFLMARNEVFVENGPPDWFITLFICHFIVIIWIIVLLIIYLINVFRNERVQEDKKILWVVIIFLGNIIAMIVYWYLYIWSESKEVILKDQSYFF
ncbi:MAG: hypothetical protein KAW88_01035 [Candidatus Cloacimonetes bacterium]|nr:hypothetical protein [Candidatus Cloacimonadota bacterium]